MMNEQDVRFMEELNECPELKEYFQQLLDAAKNKDGKINTIDEIDEYLFNNLKTGSKIVIDEWARRIQEAAIVAYQETNEAVKHGKKN